MPCDELNSPKARNQFTLTPLIAKQVQGSGAYVQAGYLMGNWQPFVMAEYWNSDGADGAGSWDSVRGGLNYFFKGHNANVKLAVENTSNDADGVDDVTTVGLGLFITY